MLGYLVDSTGVITGFLGEFLATATRYGPDLEPDQLLGQPLFSFVQGAELKQLMSGLLKSPEREKKVLPHRCDTPDRLRLWQLSVDWTGRATRFWFEQVAQRDRPFQSNLEPFPDPIVYCSWCNAIHNPSGSYNWLNVTNSYKLASLIRRQPEKVEHALCPDCSCSLWAPKKTGAFSHLIRAFSGRGDRPLKPPGADYGNLVPKR